MEAIVSNRFFKVVSTVLIFCLTLDTVVWSSPVAPQIDLPKLTSEVFHPEVEITSLANSIEIPISLGQIEKRSTGTGPLVVHISEAHGNYEAQGKIKELLEFLKKEYHFNILFLEGGFGKLDPSLLQFFPDAQSNQKTLDALVKKGAAGGAEAFLFDEYLNDIVTQSSLSLRGLATKQPGRSNLISEIASTTLGTLSRNDRIQGYGVENPELYLKNLKAFREALRQEAVTSRFLMRLKSEVLTQTSLHFNRELREFFKLYLGFQNTTEHFLSHLATLSRYAKQTLGIDFTDPRNQLEWPQVIRLEKLSLLEKKLDQKVAEAERQALVRLSEQNRINPFFSLCLKKSTLEEACYSSNGSSRSSLRDFYESFYDAAHSKGFEFTAYPELAKEISVQIIRSELGAKPLFEEIHNLSQLILSKLAQSAEEKSLLSVYEDLLLLEKLFSLELTRADYTQVLARKDELIPSRICKRIYSENDDVILSAKPEESSNHLAIQSTKNLANARSFGQRIRLRPQDDIVFQKSLSFYTLAKEREHAMFKLMTERLKETGSDRSVLVTGGFHEEGLASILKENNFSYISITPKLGGESDSKSYRNLLTLKPDFAIEASHLRPIALVSHFSQISDVGKPLVDFLLTTELHTVLETISSNGWPLLESLQQIQNQPGFLGNGISFVPFENNLAILQSGEPVLSSHGKPIAITSRGGFVESTTTPRQEMRVESSSVDELNDLNRRIQDWKRELQIPSHFNLHAVSNSTSAPDVLTAFDLWIYFKYVDGVMSYQVQPYENEQDAFDKLLSVAGQISTKITAEMKQKFLIKMEMEKDILNVPFYGLGLHFGNFRKFASEVAPEPPAAQKTELSPVSVVTTVEKSPTDLTQPVVQTSTSPPLSLREVPKGRRSNPEPEIASSTLGTLSRNDDAGDVQDVIPAPEGTRNLPSNLAAVQPPLSREAEGEDRPARQMAGRGEGEKPSQSISPSPRPQEEGRGEKTELITQALGEYHVKVADRERAAADAKKPKESHSPKITVVPVWDLKLDQVSLTVSESGLNRRIVTVTSADQTHQAEFNVSFRNKNGSNGNGFYFAIQTNIKKAKYSHGFQEHHLGGNEHLNSSEIFLGNGDFGQKTGKRLLEFFSNFKNLLEWAGVANANANRKKADTFIRTNQGAIAKKIQTEISVSEAAGQEAASLTASKPEQSFMAWLKNLFPRPELRAFNKILLESSLRGQHPMHRSKQSRAEIALSPKIGLPAMTILRTELRSSIPVKKAPSAKGSSWLPVTKGDGFEVLRALLDGKESLTLPYLVDGSILSEITFRLDSDSENNSILVDVGQNNSVRWRPFQEHHEDALLLEPSGVIWYVRNVGENLTNHMYVENGTQVSAQKFIKKVSSRKELRNFGHEVSQRIQMDSQRQSTKVPLTKEPGFKYYDDHNLHKIKWLTYELSASNLNAEEVRQLMMQLFWIAAFERFKENFELIRTISKIERYFEVNRKEEGDLARAIAKLNPFLITDEKGTIQAIAMRNFRHVSDASTLDLNSHDYLVFELKSVFPSGTEKIQTQTVRSSRKWIVRPSRGHQRSALTQKIRVGNRWVSYAPPKFSLGGWLEASLNHPLLASWKEEEILGLMKQQTSQDVKVDWFYVPVLEAQILKSQTPPQASLDFYVSFEMLLEFFSNFNSVKELVMSAQPAPSGISGESGNHQAHQPLDISTSPSKPGLIAAGPEMGGRLSYETGQQFEDSLAYSGMAQTEQDQTIPMELKFSRSLYPNPFLIDANLVLGGKHDLTLFFDHLKSISIRLEHLKPKKTEEKNSSSSRWKPILTLSFQGGWTLAQPDAMKRLLHWSKEIRHLFLKGDFRFGAVGYEIHVENAEQIRQTLGLHQLNFIEEIIFLFFQSWWAKLLPYAFYPDVVTARRLPEAQKPASSSSNAPKEIARPELRFSGAEMFVSKTNSQAAQLQTAISAAGETLSIQLQNENPEDFRSLLDLMIAIIIKKALHDGNVEIDQTKLQGEIQNRLNLFPTLFNFHSLVSDAGGIVLLTTKGSSKQANLVRLSALTYILHLFEQGSGHNLKPAFILTGENAQVLRKDLLSRHNKVSSIASRLLQFAPSETFENLTTDLSRSQKSFAVSISREESNNLKKLKSSFLQAIENTEELDAVSLATAEEIAKYGEAYAVRVLLLRKLVSLGITDSTLIKRFFEGNLPGVHMNLDGTSGSFALPTLHETAESLVLLRVQAAREFQHAA